MSLLHDVAKMATISGAEATLKGATDIVDNLEKKTKDFEQKVNEHYDKNIEKLVRADSSKDVLILKQFEKNDKFRNTYKNTFNVYDINQQPLYHVTYLGTKRHDLRMNHLWDHSVPEGKLMEEKRHLLATGTFFTIMSGRTMIRLHTHFLGTVATASFNNGWALSGNVLTLNYKIKDGKREIAKISRNFFKWGSAYIIEYDKSYDPQLIVLTVLGVIFSKRQNNDAKKKAEKARKKAERELRWHYGEGE